MNLRTILAVLEGGHVDRTELDLAGRIAKQFDSHVDVLFVRRDPRDAIPMVGEGISGSVVEQVMASVEADNEKHANAAREAFDRWTASSGMHVATEPGSQAGPSASFLDEQGRIAQVIERCGKFSELIVMKSPSIDDQGAFTPSLEAALFDSGRPVLLAPATDYDIVGSSAAVFWNDSREAGRAVVTALPLLARAKSVELMCVDEGGFDATSLDRLAAWLAWYGIQAKTSVVSADGRGSGDALISAAGEADCNLIVMGAFSRSRLRELVFGGVTRHTLEVVARPVLMAH